MEGKADRDPGAALNPAAAYDYDGDAGNDTSLYYSDDYMMCGNNISINQPEIQISQFMRMYIYPVLLFIGLLWNPVTTYALYYIGIHKWSTVFYLSLLTVVDLLILVIKAGDTWYNQLAQISISNEIMNSSDALCKTYNFFFMFMKHMSPWLVVAVSMELMISTTWPRKTYVVCTIERARNVILLLVILIFCLDINYFWTWGVPRPDYGCVYTEEFSMEFRDIIWPMLTNTVEHLLPLIFVSICFFVTAAAMISRKSRDEKSIEEELSKYFLELKTIKDFQVICLIICLMFMCLTLFKIVIIVVMYMMVKGHLVLDCEDQLQFGLSMQMMGTLHMVLTFIFYTMKVIPCFVFSSTFRQTLKDGFLWCKRMVLRIVRKITGPGRNNNNRNKKMWNSKNSKLGSSGSVNGGGGGGGSSGRGVGGDDVDGGCSQQLKPLVNSSCSNNSNPHQQQMCRGLDYPVDMSGDGESIYGISDFQNGSTDRSGRNGNGGVGRGGDGGGSGGGGGGGNSLSVVAAVGNHSMDDSRTSFLGKGTDV